MEALRNAPHVLTPIPGFVWIGRQGGSPRNSELEPLRTKQDRTGLELRKSLHGKALRILSAESVVTKRFFYGRNAKK